MDVLLSPQNETQKAKKSIQLIIIKKNKRIVYFSRCKVNVKKRELNIFPDDESASAIKVNAHINLVKYDHAIYCQNNGNNFGFALIFDHKRHCNYVFNMLEQKMIVKNAKNDVDIVENMFILPLINELRYYSQLNFDFRCFILKLLKSLDIEQKQKLAGVIIETKIDKSLLDCVFDGIEYNRSDSSQ